MFERIKRIIELLREESNVAIYTLLIAIIALYFSVTESKKTAEFNRDLLEQSTLHNRISEKTTPEPSGKSSEGLCACSRNGDLLKGKRWPLTLSKLEPATL